MYEALDISIVRSSVRNKETSQYNEKHDLHFIYTFCQKLLKSLKTFIKFLTKKYRLVTSTVLVVSSVTIVQKTLETLYRQYFRNTTSPLLFCHAIRRRFPFVFASVRLRKRIPFCELHPRLTLPPFLGGGGCNARRKNTDVSRRRFHGTLSLPPPHRVVVSPRWIPASKRSLQLHKPTNYPGAMATEGRDN